MNVFRPWSKAQKARFARRLCSRAVVLGTIKAYGVLAMVSVLALVIKAFGVPVPTALLHLMPALSLVTLVAAGVRVWCLTHGWLGVAEDQLKTLDLFVKGVVVPDPVPGVPTAWTQWPSPWLGALGAKARVEGWLSWADVLQVLHAHGQTVTLDALFLSADAPPAPADRWLALLPDHARLDAQTVQAPARSAPARRL